MRKQRLAAGLFCLLAAGAGTALVPLQAQTQQRQQMTPRDLIARFIEVNNELAQLLNAVTPSSPQPDVMTKIQAAVARLERIKAGLKASVGNPEAQQAVQERSKEIQEATAKMAAEVTRVRAAEKANKDLLDLLNRV